MPTAIADWILEAGDEPLAGIQGVTPSLTASELAAYTPDSKGFNPIRGASGRGYLPVAHRTLSTDPEWRYISVARTQRIIESSVRDGLAWATFEPNNETTWTRVRAAVETYMADLYRKGALQGAKPQDAYAVKCDRTVMTESDLAKGRLVVMVLFAPTKPAEFYATRIVLTMK